MLEALTKIEEIELRVADVYSHLERVFSHHELARTVFKRLAEEEEQHARWVSLCREAWSSDPGEQAAPVEPEIDAALEAARAVHREALSGAWDLDLASAVARLAHLEEGYDLEGWLSHDTVAARLAERGNLRALLGILASQTIEHGETLGRLARQLAPAVKE